MFGCDSSQSEIKFQRFSLFDLVVYHAVFLPGSMWLVQKPDRVCFISRPDHKNGTDYRCASDLIES